MPSEREIARQAWLHEEAGADLPSPDQLLRWWSEREITVTMPAGAATRLLAALDWASALASSRADAFRERNTARAELHQEHADSLRFGASRLRAAKERQHA